MTTDTVELLKTKIDNKNEYLFSYDNQYIGCNGKSIFQYDDLNRPPKKEVNLPSECSSFYFSERLGQLIAGTGDGIIFIINISTGKYKAFRTETGPINTVCSSKSGYFIFAAGRDKICAVNIEKNKCETIAHDLDGELRITSNK